MVNWEESIKSTFISLECLTASLGTSSLEIVKCRITYAPVDEYDVRSIAANSMIGLCTAGMLFLLSASDAKADFVTPRFDLASPSFSNGMSGAAEGQEPAERIPHERIDYYLQLEVDGLFSPGSTTGASSTASHGGSCGSPPAAEVITQSNVSGRQLIAYLLSEPCLNLPVPFLDGVFRPPRKVC